MSCNDPFQGAILTSIHGLPHVHLNFEKTCPQTHARIQWRRRPNHPREQTQDLPPG